MSNYAEVPVAQLSARQSSGRDRYRRATYWLAAVGAVVAALVMFKSPFSAVLIGALLCGWSEVDGLCGSSHVSAITPLRRLDPSLWLWRKAAIAYTVGGIVSASLVGAAMGGTVLLLRLADHRLYPAVTTALVVVVGIILGARELGLAQFELPQIRRQTNRMWAFQFGYVRGAAMWGSHIGLGFATVVMHGGWFVLVAYALTSGPVRGSLLLATYWFGRALPIWAAPTLSISDRDCAVLGDDVLGYEQPYRRIALVGIGICVASALVLLLGSSA